MPSHPDEHNKSRAVIDPIPVSQSAEPAQKHDAFISYSRKNEEFAALLEQALENYKPPKGLNLARRHLDIFRDRSDFRSGGYIANLEKHLRSSARLIVVCSPEARSSGFVDQEIQLFVDFKGTEHLIPILYSGIPNNEAAPDQVTQLAFPDALCKAMQMPLAIDYRGFEVGRDKINKNQFEAAWFQTLAAIYDVERGEIEQRDKKRKTRNQRIIYGGLFALIAVLLVMLYFISSSRDEAKRQQANAEHQLQIAQRLLYVSDLTLAQQMQQSGNMKRAHELLEKYLTQESQLRGFEWYFLMTQYHNEVATLRGHTREVTALAISPDGKTLATGSRDNTVKLWDVASRSKLFALDHDDYVFGVSFSSDGKTLATAASAGVDFKVKLWDLASRQQVGEFVGYGKGIFAWAFSPDGKLLATSGNDFTLKVWDVALRRELFTIKTHQSVLRAVAFSPDGKILAAGSRNSVRLWHVASRREFAELRIEDEYGFLNAMAFSPDGKTLAVGARETGVVWNVASGKRLPMLKGHQKGINAVAFFPNGNLVATSSDDNTIRVWEVKSGKEEATLRGHSGAVEGMAVFPEGASLALASVGETVVKLWDQASWEPPKLPRSAMINALAFSPDGELLASGTYGEATVWKVTSGQLFASLYEHTSQVNAVAFSPDSKTIAIGSHDRTLKLWGVESKKIEETLSFPQEISSVGFSPDGKSFVVGTADGSAKLFDTASRKELLTFSGHSAKVTAVAFFRDGKRLATSSEDSKVKLWEIASGSELASIEGHNGGATALALSPDGTTLASGSGDGLVRLWDVASRKELGILSGHQERITGIAFAPDGLTLATSSLDDAVKLWSLTAQSEVVTARIDLYNTSAVAFSPDGKTLVAGGALGSEARVWRVLSEEEIKKRLYGY